MSARLRLSHASGWATTCSPSKSWEASPPCVTVTTTGSQPGAVKVSVAPRFDDPFAVTVTLNDVEVLPDVRAGVHHAVLSLCVSDHEPGAQVEQPAAACGFEFYLRGGYGEHAAPGIAGFVVAARHGHGEYERQQQEKKFFHSGISVKVRFGACRPVRDGRPETGRQPLCAVP